MLPRPSLSSSSNNQSLLLDPPEVSTLGTKLRDFRCQEVTQDRDPHDDGLAANNAFSGKPRYFRPRSIHQLRSISSTFPLRLTSLWLFKIHLRTKCIFKSGQHDICSFTTEQPANLRRPESSVCRLSAEQRLACGSFGGYNGYHPIRPIFFASSSAILRQSHVCQLWDIAD